MTEQPDQLPLENNENSMEEKTEDITNNVPSQEKPTELHDAVTSSDEEKTTEPESDMEPGETPLVVKKKPGRPKKQAVVTSEEVKEELLAEKDFSGDEEDETEQSHEPEIDFNTLNRAQLIELIEQLVQEDNINHIKTRVAGIKVAFLAINKIEKQAHLDEYISSGGAKEDYIPAPDPLEERFTSAFAIYKSKKTDFDKEQENIKIINLEAKKAILEEIKQLINSEESLKKTYDEFRLLQDKWKNVGQVPRGEISDLWNNYHFLVEKFFEKVKIGKELKDLDLRKNLEQKIKICEKTEELLLEKTITRSFKLLQQYHDEWKETGPVPQDKKDEIWERFKNASDQINAQRKDHYEKLQEEQEHNLQAKNAICEKVEAIITSDIQSINDWKEKTTEILELQKLWESIGRAPVKLNDEIWERFRNGINVFFNNKKEYFSEIKDQQMDNYNRKLELCVQAEALKNNNNWKRSTSDIIRLQEEWRKIGPVPRRLSDKIWKRFRAGCDDFFKSKSEYFSGIQNNELENLRKKEELIEQINQYEIQNDKAANLEALKQFQRSWMDIGYVPMDKKDSLHESFRTAINKLMEKLKISSVELNTMNYKNRVEAMQNSPDAGRVIFKERSFLESKISKLKGDIILWENNLGFLASSKKADLLKEEFEKKINSAKQEVALLEAKLKLISRPKTQ